MKQRRVQTQIVATIGPASSSETVLRKMFAAGLDAVRLNFSHGTHKEHIEKIHTVRRLNKKRHRAIKIMQDLAGYRIRLGELKNDLQFKKGFEFYLTQENSPRTNRVVPFDYTGSLKSIKNGTLIYIDDGRVVLEVQAREKHKLKVKALAPGTLKSRKGINIIGAKLEFDAVTDKDRIDVEVAIHQKLDYLAQSFVRNRNDIRLLREIVSPRHPDCKIFAKVENREALNNLDEIIDYADGIIVARGDLGICVPIYKVPMIQKIIIQKARQKYKPVIVATQMLDSMTEDALPTRAEVSDVANAICDGATHCMLSGETAVGKHPERAVDMMNKIIKHTETVRGSMKSLLTL